MKPIRVQRKRTKGWKMPINTINVTRPGKWGNPFVVGKKYENSAWMACMYPDYNEFMQHYENGITPKTTEEAIELFRLHMETKIRLWPEETKKEMELLRGKNLACFCPLNKKCHADVLLEMANTPATQ